MINKVRIRKSITSRENENKRALESFLNSYKANESKNKITIEKNNDEKSKKQINKRLSKNSEFKQENLGQENALKFDSTNSENNLGNKDIKPNNKNDSEKSQKSPKNKIKSKLNLKAFNDIFIKERRKIRENTEKKELEENLKILNKLEKFDSIIKPFDSDSSGSLQLKKAKDIKKKNDNEKSNIIPINKSKQNKNKQNNKIKHQVSSKRLKSKKHKFNLNFRSKMNSSQNLSNIQFTFNTSKIFK